MDETDTGFGADATVAWPKAQPSQDRSPWPPRRLGPVRLVRRIGKGGMGEVWLGRDEILARDVAVKVLSTKVVSREDPEAAGFLEGAKVAAAQAHPALNRVLSADVLEGTPYLVLEYLDGPNLQELLARSRRLSLPAARAVIEAVAEAIAELHQHDLVHRDLKPSNIVLTRDGQIVVTDFGLACVRPASALRESVGAVAGTPAYMAPEMFDGVVSARTDVYAIGMTAYELLCGRPAFQGTLEELKRQHREAAVDLQPLHAAAVPQALIDVIGRTTSKNVLFRPKTARHVLEAFRTAFESAGVPRASRHELMDLVKVQTATSAQAKAPIEAPVGMRHEMLSALAPKWRDRRGKREAHNSLAAASGSCIDPAYLLHRRAQRRRMRVAAAVASLVGGGIGVAFLLLVDRYTASWDQWVNVHLAHSRTIQTATATGISFSRATPLWASAIIVSAPLAALISACMWIPLLLYRGLRGERLPDATDRTQCGWCQHELRGISTPICSECGHAIGDARRDASGLLPPGLRFEFRARLLVLLHIIFFLAWASVAIVAGVIVRLLLSGASLGPAPIFLTIFTAVALMLHSYETRARYALARSGRAWCRACKRELRELQQPVCPGCGEKI